MNNTYSWMNHVAQTTRLRIARVTRSFKPKFRLKIETENYIAKTIENARELKLALQLRHEVFYKELQGKKKWLGIELDALDFKCDHLLILDRESGEAVGTYRLLSSHFIQRFYSESEFDLSEVKKLPGHKLELGRACVREDSRNGAVMQLLWRGIANYMKITDSRWLMGCSSIQTLDSATITSITASLRESGHACPLYNVTPIFGYHPAYHGIDLTNAASNSDALAPEFPALLSAYLRAGAKLAHIPAIDRDFNCIDFFTLLDRENMNPTFERRFFG